VNIEQKVKEVIAENLMIEVEKVDNDSHLQEHLGMDSLDCIEIVMELEEQFNIEIDEDAMEQINTVQGLIDLVTNLKTKEI